MTEFTLDTSGEVECPAIIERTGEPDTICLSYRWPDLSPFEQGYTAKALEALNVEIANRARDESTFARIGARTRPVGFSDLAGETLAAIRKDCAEFQSRFGEWPKSEHGANFWTGRQVRKFDARFPPLTVSLNDAGKVVFS